MKLKDMVTSLSLSENLSKCGITQHAAFSYYKNSGGNVYLDYTDPEKKRLHPAYLTEELAYILPNEIRLSKDFYILMPEEENPFRKHYVSFVPSREDGYETAELQNLKTQHEDPSFVTRYWHNTGVIATSINNNGEFVNLITFGESEAASRAKMILLLQSENLL